MDTFFLNELKSCCADINADRENAGGISRVLGAYRRIMDFLSLQGRRGCWRFAMHVTSWIRATGRRDFFSD